MPLPKIEEARNLGDQELADQIVAVKKQLFTLRMQKRHSPIRKASPVQAHQTSAISTADRRARAAVEED